MVLFLFFSVICQIKFTHSNFFKNNNYLVYHSFCGSDIWVSEVVAFKLLVELESSYGLTGRICFSAYLWSLVAALGKSAILFSMTTASLNRNNWALFSILPEKKKNPHAWIYNRYYCLPVSMSVPKFISSSYILATCASYWPKDDKWKSDSVFQENLCFLDIDVILPSCPFLLLDMYWWEQ